MARDLFGDVAAPGPLAGQRRVELMPHFDAWMQGDRCGVVLRRLPGDRLEVLMDVSGRKLRVPAGEVKDIG